MGASTDPLQSPRTAIRTMSDIVKMHDTDLSSSSARKTEGPEDVHRDLLG